MRNRVAVGIVGFGVALVLDAPGAGAQILRTTTTTAPSETTVTTAPVTTTTAPVTTAPVTTTTVATTAPAETTTTATTAPAESTTTEPPRTTTTAATTSTSGALPPEGVTSTSAPPEVDEVLEADTGKLPLFIALSLGGIAVALAIVTVQWVRTRPA